MDSIIQIKTNLISRIQNSEDLRFLKALQSFFDSPNQAIYQLNKEQKSSINKGREQIEKGEFLENDEVISNMKSWLKSQ